MIGDFLKAKQPKPSDEKYFANVKTQGKYWDKQADRSHAEDLANAKLNKKTKKSLFGMARFDKSVPAGTRPFARRALPKEQIKQVRAKAPRYGVMKAAEQKGEKSGRVLSGPNCELCKIRGRSHPSGYVHREIREQTIRKSCNNCGQRPAQDDVPLCVGCASWMEKARKKKPDMVDHIMRMEGGEASEDEGRHAMQQMVNSGTAWKLQGSYGRAAMDMISNGHIALGHQGHRDYYGNYVPSRHEVQEGTKGHASFVRAAGNEPDKCGKDCPTPEVPNQLPQSIRNKKINKAVFTHFPLGPLAKTYVRVDASRAEGFVKGDGRGYPSSQCPACGKHGNALEVMQHMQASGHTDDDQGKNKHTMIGRGGVPELNGHTGMGTLKSIRFNPPMRKGYEFEVLDESHPEYHGHTGGGAGYAGKKWVHQHGPQASADGMAGELMPVHPKTNHRHFKMGAWTKDHSPSGYQEEILGHSDKGLDDPACSLPNCRHPLSQHVPTDDGPMGCKDCNNTRPRRNVRHEFRA